ncbi:hypothetical protein GCM10027446_29820 [Angustibacter peucedani]
MHPPETRSAALTLLARTGATTSGVSRQTGISRSTLRAWQSDGGRYAAATAPRAGCPRRHPLDGVPYAHLLGLYLGDGCISALRKGVFSLRISCDARYPGVVDECAASMAAVLANRVSRTAKPGCVDVTSYSKHWPCLFPQHGPGRKHQRPIVLEAWQSEVVQRHPGPFLRGLFHSDGCRVTNWTVRAVGGRRHRYEYPRYFFSNRSEDILRLCEWALDLLELAHRRNGPWSVSVARRASVAVLDEVVGPKS